MPENDQIQEQIAELYSERSATEREQVEATLRSYLLVVRRIFEHVKDHDPKILTKLAERAKVRKGGKGA